MMQALFYSLRQDQDILMVNETSLDMYYSHT
jgi:hypothetical protein